MCFIFAGFSYGKVFAIELIFYRSSIKTLDINPEYYSTEVAQYDLNDDGEMEFIVRTICKSDECPRYMKPSLIAYDIYNQAMFKDFNNNGPYKKSMLSIGGFGNSISILDTKHDDYHDINVICNPKNNEYAILEYDKKYNFYSLINNCI